MNTKLSLILVAILLILISGCSSTLPMIGSISDRNFSLQTPEAVPIGRNDVISAYQRYLDVSNGNAMQIFAERRIADLHLETGEFEVLPDDSWRQTKGQQKIQNAVNRYRYYLKKYPNRPENDQIWYQLAHAYSVTGDADNQLKALTWLVNTYPNSQYTVEAIFRLGEGFFFKKQYSVAAKWYQKLLMSTNDPLYLERALYKLSWSHYKKGQYKVAINNSIELIDRQFEQGKLTEIGYSDTVTLTEKNLFEDLINIVILSFSNIEGKYTIDKYFSMVGHRGYEPLLYKKLAQFYYNKDRFIDAANTYMTFTKTNSLNYLAVDFHLAALKIYKKNGLKQFILNNKSQFISNFGVSTPFWNRLNKEQSNVVASQLKIHITDLAKHSHSMAQKTKMSLYYKNAVKWYREYIRSFPHGSDTANNNFLLSEILFEGKMFDQAIIEYVKTAYDYPAHVRSAESGYAAILAYKELKKQISQNEWSTTKVSAVNNSLKFLNTFTEDRHVSAVMARTTEQLYSLKDYYRAAALAKRLLDNSRVNNGDYRLSARTILSHSQFELALYPEAEKSYLITLSQLGNKHDEYADLVYRLAETIYRQAEKLRDKKKFRKAAYQFLRVGKTLPESDIRIQSEYDAAAMFIHVQDWNRAAVILEHFREAYPNNKKLKQGVVEKLALIYSKTGQGHKAANELLTLAKKGKRAFKKKMIWKAAEMYQLANMNKEAVGLYKKYINQYPYPLETSMDAREIIADYYIANDNSKKNKYWLRKMIKADKNGGSHRTLRTNYLAATATLKLAQPKNKQYHRAKLTLPLKSSLKLKKRLMKKSIKAYERAMKYKISSIYTQATYEIAEVYSEFASSMMNSQRPKGLNEDQLEEYDLMMEEQSFPFEEKAIEIHLANTERTLSGVYDDGVKNSFKALEKLFPIRYLKPEKVEPYIESLY